MWQKKPEDLDCEYFLRHLAANFPLLRPLVWMLGVDRTTSRFTALLEIFLQVLLIFAFATSIPLVVMLAEVLKPWLSFAGEAVGGLLIVVLSPVIFSFVTFFMVVSVFSLNRSFDLFYLFVTGNNFNMHNTWLWPIKILVIVAGFVASVGVVGAGCFRIQQHFSDQQREQQLRQQLQTSQQEYLSYLDQGRAAWNRYITQKPQNLITFRDADLSRRHFKGFYFHCLDFSGANLTATTFEDCYLGGANFSHARMKNTVFRHSYLRMATFVGTDLAGADLTGAFCSASELQWAVNAEPAIEKLVPCDQSRWHGVSWRDFHDVKWLQENGYTIGDRKPLGLEF